MPPRLPQELAEMIIDELGDTYQRPTLAACSLTCRAWLHRSRVHIHSAVRLDPNSHLDRLSELYSGPLADYVRSLSIDASRLKKIHRLALEALVWEQLEEQTVRIFLTNYDDVRDVWLAACDFYNPAAFVRLLQSFGKADSIRMEGMGCDPVDFEEALEENGPVLHLQALDVGELCNAPSIVARWAYHGRKEVVIESIHFSWNHEDPVHLSRLLQLAGPSVKSLSITMDDHVQRVRTTPGELQGAVDLSQNTGLRTLRVLLRLETSNYIEVSWIGDVLSQLSSQLLAHILIFIELPSYELLDKLRWDLIDSALADTRIPALKKVECCILRRYMLHQGLDPNAINRVRNALPKLAALGILEVSQEYT
ncbi:uncharacterized protein B0H18DRAFT_1083847 [Fomitopsis serialis]|uniref:uncharacterized protein n=1 Tax=Fomitopsis serialis TaxID=139415 RepID=UPI00200894BF|nr:uncharacterized protein B0H18DRAFT_1083847 [Neoantrodia serialis]KAH9930205.1 hypothetical protein B0H18DRAFT_1083847 [Neoantrodia serialis]